MQDFSPLATILPAPPTAAAVFKVGEIYSTRSACDYDCQFHYEVIARTAKYITVKDARDEVRRVGVKNAGGDEWAQPAGTYSMAPVITAIPEPVVEIHGT